MSAPPTTTSWLHDASVGFAAGAVYGAVSLVVGHPLDTVKVKMQAHEVAKMGSAQGPLSVAAMTLRREGIVGLYRGCVPPLVGSSVLRSTQFGVYESVHSALSRSSTGFSSSSSNSSMTIATVDWKIWAAGGAAGAARAVLECPLDVMKIQRQVGGVWHGDSSLMSGLGLNMIRNVGLLSIFFVLVDISKRHEMNDAWRPLITGSVCSTMAWTVVWPFDVIKSRVQAEAKQVGAMAGPQPSLIEQFQRHYQQFGWRGFTRGYVPGATRSLIANGTSMVAYVWAKKVFGEKIPKDL